MKDFWDWNRELILTLLGLVCVMALVVYGLLRLSEYTCYAKTANMGFETRWSALGGCQIEVIDGQWIPLDSYYFKQE